jgi:hypothetical protein
MPSLRPGRGRGIRLLAVQAYRCPIEQAGRGSRIAITQTATREGGHGEANEEQVVYRAIVLLVFAFMP